MEKLEAYSPEGFFCYARKAELEINMALLPPSLFYVITKLISKYQGIKEEVKFHPKGGCAEIKITFVSQQNFNMFLNAINWHNCPCVDQQGEYKNLLLLEGTELDDVRNWAKENY